MDSSVAFIYLFGMFGGRKIVLCDWSNAFFTDVPKDIHYLLGAIDFFFFLILGELGSARIIRCYLDLLERESVSCTNSAPSSWQSMDGWWDCGVATI